MKEKFEVKHNLKGAFILGLIISISLLVIFLLSKGFAMPYMEKIPSVYILALILCIGVYIMWSNCCLRRIIIEGEDCVYINMFGRKKEFKIDNIGKIVLKDNDNVFLYDNNGTKICKIESNMINLEEFWEYVGLRKGSVVKCSEDELENRVEQNYKNFTNYLKRFFLDNEKLDITLEYGFQIEENKDAIFYILKLRAKNRKGYLGQNFLKIGNWEYRILFLGYKKERKTISYCEEEKLEYYVKKLYKELIRIKKKENIVKKSNLAPYEMMEEISI